MTRPRIGITTSLEEDEQRIHRGYVQSVVKAGGYPVIIPMFDDDELLNHCVERLDGLVMSGGPAIDIGLVGNLPDDLPVTPEPRRSTDIKILESFLASRKPVLGICYGMQMINALAGGTIYADVEKQSENVIAHSVKRGATSHFINVNKDSKLSEILGGDRFEVNTRHIQAIASPGAQLNISARADDGVIEALENADGTVLGVQFHPERMDTMIKLFEHLVANASK